MVERAVQVSQDIADLTTQSRRIDKLRSVEFKLRIDDSAEVKGGPTRVPIAAFCS